MNFAVGIPLGEEYQTCLAGLSGSKNVPEDRSTIRVEMASASQRFVLSRLNDEAKGAAATICVAIEAGSLHRRVLWVERPPIAFS